MLYCSKSDISHFQVVDVTLYDRTDFWTHPLSEAENYKPLQVCFKQTFPLNREVSEDTTE